MLGPDIFDGMTVLQKQVALASAQAALIALQSGQKLASVSYSQGDGTKSASFSQTDLGALMMLIKQLQASLGIACRTRRPFRFIY